MESSPRPGGGGGGGGVLAGGGGGGGAADAAWAAGVDGFWVLGGLVTELPEDEDKAR